MCYLVLPLLLVFLYICWILVSFWDCVACLAAFWHPISLDEDILEFCCMKEVPIRISVRNLKNLEKFTFFIGDLCAFLGECDPTLLGY